MLREARGTVSLAERLAHDLHPLTAFVVVPLFALANAGLTVDRDALAGQRRRGAGWDPGRPRGRQAGRDRRGRVAGSPAGACHDDPLCEL
jgi:hypothetical protein